MDSEDDKRLGVRLQRWTPPPRPDWSVMQGRFCRVEPLTPAHAADLHEANRIDDAIWDYMGYGPFGSEAEYAAWVESMAGKPDPMFFAVIDPASGRALGVASWLRIDPANGVIEVGHINFSPTLQRTPAATEAMALMMARVFGLGYRRYEWKCNALNLPSRRAAQRYGFSYEGVFRQAVVSKGRNRDTAWFAMIDAEWPRLKAAFDSWLAPGNFDAEGRQRQALSALTAPILVSRDPALAG
ncbi:GNAT family N-acetyltransferase [Frigidibacter sp. ROC022]|uniref:GNAT family N-acetyltransferase n=1 Tax=Frigidibacter sp. ROC022 TaxID=2971796 RepID=UPI00215A9AC9|nr:GNAT family protein [Frigidibacter sp. ROC022]MCR8726244.1 GNAT family N-acetyltransferase [Frigidibacter sp. ROC022]